MKSPSATHDWLKRVSDYHSGSVGDAERAAVEAHLATCQQCQEAFAMYRRFYSLLRSPLRLGPPSLHFDGDTDFGDATTRPVARANRSASRTWSSVSAAQRMPISSTSRTARVTAGWPWPRRLAPWEFQ